MSIVHVVGTGTIGEPLIGLFLRYKEQWGITEVTFHKNRPLAHDAAKIKQLVKAGGVLTSDRDKFEQFNALGLDPQFNREEAIKRADVVVDCTPAGMKGLPFYKEVAKTKDSLFIAQGSEKNFGTPYARGINEECLTRVDPNFLQVVSCNTHNIAVLVDTMARLGKIANGDFVCIRRSNDISQNKGMSPSIDVNEHSDPFFGTHHAKDATDLFLTIGEEVPLFSSACKINSQYMHSIRFQFVLDNTLGNEEALADALLHYLEENKKIAITHETCANKIFSFGREYGHHGRILNQTVVSIPSLSVMYLGKRQSLVTGFCFTPQDGNSLNSSVAATLWHLHGRDWNKVDELMDALRPYLFQEI